VQNQTTRKKFRTQLIAAIIGTAIFAPPCCFLGVESARGNQGVVAGVVIGIAVGSLVGLGVLNRFIGPAVIWIIGTAIVAAILGPSIDLDPANSVWIGAIVGCLFAISGWRGLFLVLIGALGAFLGSFVTSIFWKQPFIGLAIGANVGVLIASIAMTQIQFFTVRKIDADRI
jgi:hypothetical protein